MKKISNTAYGIIANSWLSQIEEGDKIVFKGNYAILYNEEGCEIDRVNLD
jgi:hypothetical protein